jgi:hypothetical protein
MLVSHRLDHDKKIIITTFAPEEATLALFLDAFSKYQEELKYLPDYQSYNELVDFRPITSINISAAELKKFGNFTLAADNREHVTRLALIVDSKPAFTLAKVYETFRNLSPSSKKQVRVFRDMDEAMVWLATDTSLKSGYPV